MAGKLRIEFNEDGGPTATVSGDIPVESQQHLQELLGWVGVKQVETEAGGAEQDPATNVPPPAPSTLTPDPTMNAPSPTSNPLKELASGEPADGPSPPSPEVGTPETPAANEAHFTQSGEPGSMGVLDQDAGMVPPVQQPAPQPSLNITEEKTPGVIPHGWDVPAGVNEPPSFAQDQFSPSNQMNPSMLPIAAPGVATPIMDTLIAEEQNLPEVQLVQPPRGFSPQQWQQLLPNEQMRYYELQPLMNDAINKHDHEGLRTVAAEITALQRKMREMPITGHHAHMEPYQNQQVLPPPVAQRAAGKSIYSLSILPSFDVRFEKAVFEALDLGSPFYDPIVKGAGPAKGYKYVWKERSKGGKGWNYHYKEDPHPENHGLGETAVDAAAHGQTHSIELHSEVDNSKHGTPEAGYRSTVRLTSRRSPESLSWIKQNLDGSYSVYRQTADDRKPVLHTEVESAPDSLAAVKPKKGIALSKYKREHVQIRHKDASSSESTTMEEWRTSEGKVQAVLINKPGSAYPYQIHEFGEKVIAPGRSYGEFATEGSAKRAMRFHQAKSAVNKGTSKPFEKVGATSKLDSEKLPIAHKIETGQCEYEARTTKDPLTGHSFSQLVPKLSREEHKNFISGEVGGIIQKAVRDVTADRGLSSEQTADLVRSCALDAWQACVMRQGGKKTGGFEPGESTNLLGLIRTTLRAQGGSINQWLAQNSGAPGEDQHGGGSETGTVSGKAYVSASDWRDSHRETWADSQKDNWLVTHGAALSEGDRKVQFGKLSASLANVKNRSQAQRFSRENIWADKPMLREISTGKVESQAQQTPEQVLSSKQSGGSDGAVDQWEGFSVTNALESAAKELGSGNDKKHSFLNTMASNLRSNMDGGKQMEAASAKMNELFPKESSTERQKKLRSWIQEYATHGQVQAAREYLARSLVQPLNSADALPRNNPLYSYASGIVMRSSVRSVLKGLSDSLAGDNDVKKSVLYKAVAATFEGGIDDTWFTHLVLDTIRLCRLDKSMMNAVAETTVTWLKELNEHSVFKGVTHLLKSHGHTVQAELSGRMGNLWLLSSFEEAALA